jgi:hypothetical protein
MVARKARADHMAASAPRDREVEDWYGVWRGLSNDFSIPSEVRRGITNVIAEFLLDEVAEKEDRAAKTDKFMEYLVAQAGSVVAAIGSLFFSGIDDKFRIAKNNIQRAYLKGVALFLGGWSLFLELRAERLSGKLGVEVISKTVDRMVLLMSIGSFVWSFYEFMKVFADFRQSAWTLSP